MHYVSLANSVRESDAPGNAEDDHTDYEELNKEAHSDEEQDKEQDAEDAEEWVYEVGDLGPKDGEAKEDNGYNDHYAPF